MGGWQKYSSDMWQDKSWLGRICDEWCLQQGQWHCKHHNTNHIDMLA